MFIKQSYTFMIENKEWDSLSNNLKEFIRKNEYILSPVQKNFLLKTKINNSVDKQIKEKILNLLKENYYINIYISSKNKQLGEVVNLI